MPNGHCRWSSFGAAANQAGESVCSADQLPVGDAVVAAACGGGGGGQRGGFVPAGLACEEKFAQHAVRRIAKLERPSVRMAASGGALISAALFINSIAGAPSAADRPRSERDNQAGPIIDGARAALARTMAPALSNDNSSGPLATIIPANKLQQLRATLPKRLTAAPRAAKPIRRIRRNRWRSEARFH